MNSSLKIWVLFGSSVLAIVVMIILCTSMDQEFGGRTPSGWIEARTRAEVPKAEFERAVSYFGTNILSAFISIYEPPHRIWMQRKGLSIDEHLPKFLRARVKETQPEWKYGETAQEAIFALRVHPESEQVLLHLKQLQKQTPDAHAQALTMSLIFSFCTGEGTTRLKSNVPFNHSEFSVRYVAAYLGNVNSRASMSEKQARTALATQVFLEAVTNTALMIETFGKGNEHWKTQASDILKRTAPEAYLKAVGNGSGK